MTVVWRGTFFTCVAADAKPTTHPNGATANMGAGWQAYETDTGKLFTFDGATTWTEVGAGGSHPNLATHDALGLATDAELTTHAGAADPHTGYRLESVAIEAFPVGAVFIAVVSTNPNTLLGYGTWSQIAAGRVLVGQDAGDADFDIAEETGGAKTASGVVTHTHPVTDPGHTHLTQRYPTATGSLSGFTIDTSMSGTLADNTLPTKSGTTGITTAAPAGAVASISVVQPYFVIYCWKRTA